jgi:predicted transcriptional regulator of viral defense system
VHEDNNRLDRERELFKLADQQAGYFTAGQAKALGYSYRVQHHHRSQGNWLDKGWGIFRLRDYPTSSDEQFVELSLWSRDKRGNPQAVVSYESALSLYELTDLLPANLHLTVPSSFRKVPPEGVVLHKGTFKEGEVKERSSFRITSPLRTLLDIAVSHVSPEHVEQAVTEAVERGLVRRKVLEEALEKSSSDVKASLQAILRQL